MTIVDLHTYLAQGLVAYQSGGSGWLLPGVQKAISFDAVDGMQGGKLVFAWLGAGRPLAGNAATTSFDLEVPVFLRGRIIGDLSTLEADALAMTEDLIRVLLVGDGNNSGDISGRTELSSFAEPQINIESRTADVLVVGRAVLPREVQ